MDTSQKLVDVRREEWPAVLWAAGWFFCVLASYYAVRPVREAFGVGEGPANLRWMYTGTFVAMLAATPLYGWLVRVTPKRRLPAVVYGLFAANLVAFWILFGRIPEEDARWLRWAFYIWVSAYNLYITAVFWSAAVELFSSEQAKRVFGLLAAAGTLGGLAGSEMTRAAMRTTNEPRNAALLSAGLLIVGIVCSLRFRAAAGAGAGEPAEREPQPHERSEFRDALGGMLDVIRSPYLACLAALMVLTSVAGTGVYMQMTDFVRTQITDPVARADYFARLNNYQNSLTLLGQLLAVGWLMRRLGLGVTLAIVPAVYLGGFAAIALWPTLFVHGLVDVAQRVAAFAAGVPAREVLFTVVSPDEKYRAKAFIDTVGKRAGDAAAAHAYAGLRSVSWAPPAIALATMPIALAIAVVSLWLAREQKRRALAATR